MIPSIDGARASSKATFSKRNMEIVDFTTPKKPLALLLLKFVTCSQQTDKKVIQKR